MNKSPDINGQVILRDHYTFCVKTFPGTVILKIF